MKGENDALIEETEALYEDIRLGLPQIRKRWSKRTISSSDSSSFSGFASSFGASAAGAPPAAATGAADAAGAPPPEPTFDRRSFTFFPSSALASSDAQIGSTSTPAPFVNARIFSD